MMIIFHNSAICRRRQPSLVMPAVHAGIVGGWRMANSRFPEPALRHQNIKSSNAHGVSGNIAFAREMKPAAEHHVDLHAVPAPAPNAIGAMISRLDRHRR